MTGSAFGIGYKALKSLCSSGTTTDWYKYKLEPDMFKPGELQAFEFVSQHVHKHKQLPHVDTLVQAFPDLQVYQVPEPSSYYLEHLENRFYYELINSANIASQQALKDNPQKPGDAKSVLLECTNRITRHQHRTKIVSLSADGPTMVMTAYHKAIMQESLGIFGWPYLDNMTGGLMAGDFVSIVGRPAAGKAQPLTSKVLTPEGFKLMGDIQVGDPLASVDGGPSEVTGVYPQGLRSVFKLTFQDGRTVEASDEHLWEVHYREWDAPKIETTLQLIARLKHSRYKRRLSIRLFSGEFGQTLSEPFSPYLLGVFLGDGCLRGSTPSLTSVDGQIIDAIDSELRKMGLELSQGWGRGGIQYSAADIRMGHKTQENRLRAWFKTLGVWGLKSEHKHIPERYMTADYSTRLALLQGLMDTDGTAEKSGGASFSSSSKVMATQVQQLVRSMGGKARLSFKKTNRHDHWRVSIVMADRANLFTISRKALRVERPRTTHVNHRLTLESIEYLREDDCQCISVSHPSRLYITDDFVVTHNTWLVLYHALQNWLKGKAVLVVSMEMSPLAILQRLVTMYTHTNISQLKLGAYSSSTYNKFKNSCMSLGGVQNPLYVVDGNLAVSVEETFVLAEQLKADIVDIDGAYLMKHQNLRLDRYTRVAENAELLKQSASSTGKPTLASYQFARSAVKDGKKKKEVGLEDIGYTDVIGQVSSVALGLFQDESVETIEGRQVRILKGRNGEVGQFNISWDFANMEFGQKQVQDDQQLGQLEYI